MKKYNKPIIEDETIEIDVAIMSSADVNGNDVMDISLFEES